MQRSDRRGVRPRLVGSLVAVIAVGGTTLLATALAAIALRNNPADHLANALGIFAAALFLGAGVLRVSRWRIAGDQRSLLMGTALLVLGGLVLPLTGLAGLLMGPDRTSMLQAATAVSTSCVTLALVLWALTSRGSATPRPAPLLVGSCATVIALFLSVVSVHEWAPALLTATNVPPEVVRGALLSVAWLYVGLEAALRSEQRPWAGRVAPLLGCMGVAELFRVASQYHDGGWELAAAGLVAALAALSVHRSLADLDEATTTEHERLDAVADALDKTRAGVDEQQAWREELEHDARNALAGLRAALMTLEQYQGLLDVPASERLRTAALGEISHLEHLIIRTDHSESLDFDVAEVVSNVVEAQRANGVRISLHTTAARAHGRPGDLATCLQNLLVNARDHGGDQVTVQVVSMPGSIEVYVADRGPGLTEGQIATLFQRGARGPSSRGSGLGLHVSRTLMRQQGGDLQLRCHHGGAVFAMVLAPAAERRAVPPGRQRRPTETMERAPATLDALTAPRDVR